LENSISQIHRKFSQALQTMRNLLKWRSEEGNFKRHENKILISNDNIIERFFKEQATGFYVDIGAGRPVSNSLTYPLYQKGWKGICFDPLPENRNLHKFFRPRDKFIRSLVGVGPKKMLFFHLKHYSYSTTSEEVAARLILDGTARLVKKFMVEQIPLSDYMKSIPREMATFLKIDTEGNDLEVLKTNDWQFFKPDLICVETWESTRVAISNFLLEMGYSMIGKTDDNAFFAVKR
jgi:FkbM family methyltransferase